MSLTAKGVSKKAAIAEQVNTGETIAMSLRLSRKTHDRLRQLAFDKRGSMRDFIVRGIEEVLEAEKY